MIKEFCGGKAGWNDRAVFIKTEYRALSPDQKWPLRMLCPLGQNSYQPLFSRDTKCHTPVLPVRAFSRVPSQGHPHVLIGSLAKLSPCVCVYILVFIWDRSKWMSTILTGSWRGVMVHVMMMMISPVNLTPSLAGRRLFSERKFTEVSVWRTDGRCDLFSSQTLVFFCLWQTSR